MMKRQSKQEGRPLLMQEAPVLSDDMPASPAVKVQVIDQSKKKSWRKRLFRKVPKKKGDGNNAGKIVPTLSASSSSESASTAPATHINPDKRDDCRQSTNTSAAVHQSNETDQPQTPPSRHRGSLSKTASPQAHTFGAPASKEMASMSSAVAHVLRRPFGREAVSTKDQTWLVQVTPAEWDAEHSVWMYRITVQKRGDGGEIIQDYTSGLTCRTLADFYWLEQSLLSEFHGGLLLSSLSISLGVPDLQTCQHEVDSHLLTYWLSDILNGVRGQGELLLNVEKIDLISSESFEAFLYRTDLAHSVELPTTPAVAQMTGTGMDQDNPTSKDKDSDLWNWIYPEFCSGGCGESAIKDKHTLKNPLKAVNCSSRALGDARTLRVQDSLVEESIFETPHSHFAVHPELLHAEKELVWSWRTHSLQTMEKLRVLQEQEKHVGAAWKRFAISVSNLFAYEKDVESARLGDAKTRKDLQIPYRKLQKSAVDDCLRIIARQKVERSAPSLEILSSMLSAFVGDLSAVQPSIQAYLEGLRQLSQEKHQLDLLRATARNKKAESPSFADQLQASLLEVKKQIENTLQEEEKDERSSLENDRLGQQEQRLRNMEARVLVNEGLLKEFLTLLCETSHLRLARMASLHFQAEMKQCSLVHSAAANLKSKINVASKESLSKMIQRHHAESKEDRSTELHLVQRLVNITNSKRFSRDEGNTTEEVEKGVEINKEIENEEAHKAKLRDAALEQCRERIGRWDAKLAMALMEAVGVKDANVRVEETTRDLRLVRKYAIGLRENVERCVEALEVLRLSIVQGGVGDIRDLRFDFAADFQMLLSGSGLPSEDQRKPVSMRALRAAGVPVNDPLGWCKTDEGTCGAATKKYVDNRDSNAEWLLRSLGDLLREYNDRVEEVESFVYMECVGIQLEKHFSQSRATALAAFEKKTDITSAINIATRKRMPVLVKELQAKLESVGTEVSHTTVKEAKEAHLESKTLKQELHNLALRRLARSRETSTERVIALLTVWAKEEESSTAVELRFLKDLTRSVEASLGLGRLEAYLEASPAPSSNAST